MNAADRPASVAAVLERGVARHPAAEALVTRSGRYSYAELDRMCDRAAAALAALGIRRGDVVAVCLPNDTDVVVAFHGAMRLGAVWVGVNRNLAPPEKRHLLTDSAATLLLADPDTVAGLRGERLPARVVEVGVPGDWAEALAEAADVSLAPIDPFAPAGIAYTSGTTGHPKGAVHSQHNLVVPGAVLVATRGYDERLRKGDCFPLTILNLQVLTTLLTAQAGGCAVIMDRLDPVGVGEWIRRERVTTWNGPPALLHDLVAHEDIAPADFASLDEVWTGGGDCPEALRERFAAKFGRPVVATYGLSEAPTVVSIDDRTGGHVAGASGRPLPHLDVRIVDDLGADCATGETGEVCVGPATTPPWAGWYRPMLGYLGRPEADALALAGGLLHTGDLGFVDAEGFLHLRDRKSLLIVRGGANVYPAEVERVLVEAPGVAACAVFGVPDERLGERVAAAVVLCEGAVADRSEWAAFCGERLARYKVPEDFRVVPALPRNAMGKVVRTELRTLADEAPR